MTACAHVSSVEERRQPSDQRRESKQGGRAVSPATRLRGGSSASADAQPQPVQHAQTDSTGLKRSSAQGAEATSEGGNDAVPSTNEAPTAAFETKQTPKEAPKIGKTSTEKLAEERPSPSPWRRTPRMSEDDALKRISLSGAVKSVVSKLTTRRTMAHAMQWQSTTLTSLGAGEHLITVDLAYDLLRESLPPLATAAPSEIAVALSNRLDALQTIFHSKSDDANRMTVTQVESVLCRAAGSSITDADRDAADEFVKALHNCTRSKANQTARRKAKSATLSWTDLQAGLSWLASMSSDFDAKTAREAKHCVIELAAFETRGDANGLLLQRLIGSRIKLLQNAVRGRKAARAAGAPRLGSTGQP